MAKQKVKEQKEDLVFESLQKLYYSSERVQINTDSRLVIFSDLHMGDGSSSDDFLNNSELFKTAIQQYYAKKKYALVLNGDVEELQKFDLDEVEQVWESVYKILDQFAARGELYKTIGNHDLKLYVLEKPFRNYKLFNSIRFQFGENDLFLFHGHQASKRYQRHNRLIGFTLKYFANPLGIRNYSVAHSSKKQYKIERRVYDFSTQMKVASIIGHTHRPLFESLNKVERIKFKIEELCREYVKSKGKRTEILKESLSTLKSELQQQPTSEFERFSNYIYNQTFHIPCLFNSGCVIGKRGMTCLEIENGHISLVHWFNKKIDRKYLNNNGYEAQQLGDSDFYRMVINREDLDYIFARIKYLS
jgi:UDP-2,3-diacylglucosamine pyrophosphatase LpxH